MIYAECPVCGANNPAEDMEELGGHKWYDFNCEECHTNYIIEE